MGITRRSAVKGQRDIAQRQTYKVGRQSPKFLAEQTGICYVLSMAKIEIFEDIGYPNKYGMGLWIDGVPQMGVKCGTKEAMKIDEETRMKCVTGLAKWCAENGKPVTVEELRAAVTSSSNSPY